MKRPDPGATLVWFRRDFRLTDNPALDYALRQPGPVALAYVYDDHVYGNARPLYWDTGRASKVWLHHTLHVFSQAIAEAGGRLIIRQGWTEETLMELALEVGARRVVWNRLYEPALLLLERRLKRILKSHSITVSTFPGALLHEPDDIHNKQDRPFRVFTPFYRHCQTLEPPAEPAPGVSKLPRYPGAPASESIASLSLLPRQGWHRGMMRHWQPGFRQAAQQLQKFCGQAIHSYTERRDYPDEAGVSALSPCLHFGELSPRQVWHAARAADSGSLTVSAPVAGYLRQLYWREFAHHLLFHFPQTALEPMDQRFRAFPWRVEPTWLRAWQRGETGYPLVDAGMRQLWATGWMHNRVRMVVGSFLVKHLLQHWHAGAEWFQDTLVDADAANNTLGWQWIAGCGADAAPYFRVFNPTLQSEKFDPQGRYLRRWLPELARLDDTHIHKPWQAPPVILQAAGVTLDGNWPPPIVDHATARRRALAAYARIRELPPPA